jgi:hypothetical protein
MKVFCNPQVERCFTVPDARRMYATSDQLAVAEINHFHLIGAVRCRSDGHNQMRESRCCREQACTTQRSDPASKDTQLTRENRVISYWYGL